ncbi:phenylalanine ammonia-lyase [Parathielavia hyrcaniae]|uniref:Phenylalanine ammonia-lyase n=1 Tax=Parathielavia hyrcaniae TaxID=113614 RepID=A0AAN6Q3U9_9PEZI|nr:phenylalanine ammonia-lyase [Parathielavia hyrcaniae]
MAESEAMGTNKKAPQSTMATPHASATYAEWVALQNQLGVLVNGRDLTLADVVAVSLNKTEARLTQDPEDLKLVSDSVAFLESEIEAGRIIYGVNTGFGGSADTRTQNLERLQSCLIQHLNVGILLKADKTGPGLAETPGNGLLRSHALPAPIVRAAMLIRCNSLMRGHSGVRIPVIQSVMRLLSLDMTPVTPLRGSVSASGDLSTLSYIAGAIEGNPDVFVRVAGKDGNAKVLPANEALKLAGLEPVRLQAKEGLGITNGTSPSCAAASLAIHQANQLALLTQVLTAMCTEALKGTANNYHPFISAARPHEGQAEVASNILHFLSGSKICPPTSDPTNLKDTGLAQDRYALRTAPQWLGPQLEDLRLATRQVTAELNSTTDNPLLELSPEGPNRIHHGGNFQAHAITSAMEKTLLALQNLGRLLFAQSSELINHATNKGLPPNLSFDDPSQSFTCKGFDVNMAAYAAELGYLAKPISSHVQIAEMANQSVNSMALVAARYALEAVEVVGLMAATHLYVLCQALDLRCLRIEFDNEVEKVVKGVLEECFSTALADHQVGLVEKVTEAIMGRWDQLSNLDLADRCKTAVDQSLGTVIDCLGESVASLKGVRDYQTGMAAAMESCFADIRTEFVRHQTTTDHISPASRVVYDFVRKELNIPLNRGVEDHPTLLLQKLKGPKANGTTGNGLNGHGTGADEGNSIHGEPDEELAKRGRIMGTLAGEIYEALRRGELHDRLMKFGGEKGLWN